MSTTTKLAPIQPKSFKEIMDNLKAGKDGLHKISFYANEVFKHLDNIHYKLVCRVINNAELSDKYLSIATGYRGYLNPLVEALEAFKKGNENSAFIANKNETEDKVETDEKGKQTKIKFTATIGAIVASQAVQEIREIRNAVRSYVNQADIDVDTLRTKLSYYKGIIQKGQENG